MKELEEDAKFEQSPKKKFIQKLDDNEFNNSFATDPKNVTDEMNNDQNKVTENDQVNMESWNDISIAKHQNRENFQYLKLKIQ